jgi:hypothetical protein
MAALRPLTDMNEIDLKRTQAAVDGFLAPGGDGPQLHKLLQAIEAEQTHQSYVSDFWSSMYLEGRWAPMIHSNPGGSMSCNVFDESNVQGQVPRAARMVSAALHFLQV